MAAVTVEIRPKPSTDPAERRHITLGSYTGPEPELVEDMDDYVENAMCSCNAGDDNPY